MSHAAAHPLAKEHSRMADTIARRSHFYIFRHGLKHKINHALSVVSIFYLTKFDIARLFIELSNSF